MAQLNNFNPSAIEPSKSFQVIPIGEYLMVFTDSEMKTTKNNTGSYLQLTAEIIDGEYQRRRVWARLNLDNPNQTAVDIAKRDLSAICHALNLGTTIVQDSSQLHGIPFIGELKIRPASGTYEASNEFKGYKTFTGVQPKPVNADPTPIPNPVNADPVPTGAPAAEFWK